LEGLTQTKIAAFQNTTAAPEVTQNDPVHEPDGASFCPRAKRGNLHQWDMEIASPGSR